MTRPPERELYRQLYEHPQYSERSPGTLLVAEFLRFGPPKGSTLLDIGCGTGVAGLALLEKGELRVTLLDFVDNCLALEVREAVAVGRLRFIEADITEGIPVIAMFGFCTDVLEHIPPEAIDRTLDHCFQACRFLFLQVANFRETHGLKYVGHELHLTNRPLEWWLEKLKSRGQVLVYREVEMRNETDELMPDGGLYNFLIKTNWR